MSTTSSNFPVVLKTQRPFFPMSKKLKQMLHFSVSIPYRLLDELNLVKYFFQFYSTKFFPHLWVPLTSY